MRAGVFPYAGTSTVKDLFPRVSERVFPRLRRRLSLPSVRHEVRLSYMGEINVRICGIGTDGNAAVLKR